VLCNRNIPTEPLVLLKTPAGRLVISAGGMTEIELLGA